MSTVTVNTPPPTNPFEWLNGEVERRTEVLGIAPSPAALHRRTAYVHIEAHDQYQVAERHYLSEGSMGRLDPPTPTALEPHGGHTGAEERSLAGQLGGAIAIPFPQTHRQHSLGETGAGPRARWCA